MPDMNEKAAARRKVSGIVLRPCICRRATCVPVVKEWIRLKDDRRCGYLRLPAYSTKDTDRGAFVRDLHRVFTDHALPKVYVPASIRHVTPFSEKNENRQEDQNTTPNSTKSKQYLYVAFHHFDPRVLSPGNKGPPTEVTPTVAKALGLHDSDRIKYGPQKEQFYCSPNYSWNAGTLIDLKVAGGIVPVDGGSSYVLPCRPLPAAMQTPVAPPRRDPEDRRHDANVRRAAQCPEPFVCEYEELERALIITRNLLKTKEAENEDLQTRLNKKADELTKAIADQKKYQAGLSRANILSDEWHEKNDGAAMHLFGLTWNDFKIIMTEGIFPDVKLDQSADGPISDFEKIMMACMRSRRAYTEDTLGFIFGVRQQRVNEALALWLPKLGMAGLYGTILDADFSHNYLSEEACTRHGIEHLKL